jgi:hypothetical protein
MTQQIRDLVVYDGRDLRPYFPEDEPDAFVTFLYGINPARGTCSTACWRACRTIYEIKENQLYLTDFYACLYRDGRGYEGPRLNKEWPRFAPDGERRFHHNFNNHYSLDFPLDYTGSMVIGQGLSMYPLSSDSLTADFYREYIAAIGSRWCHEDSYVQRFKFKKGRIVQHEDLSELNARYRKEINAKQKRRQNDLMEQAREKIIEPDFKNLDEEPPF